MTSQTGLQISNEWAQVSAPESRMLKRSLFFCTKIIGGSKEVFTNWALTMNMLSSYNMEDVKHNLLARCMRTQVLRELACLDADWLGKWSPARGQHLSQNFAESDS